MMMTSLLNQLTKGGILIVFSMFHRSWKRLLGPSKVKSVFYKPVQSHTVKVPGKRARRRPNAVAVLVASKSILEEDEIAELSRSDFVNFRQVKENDYPHQTADNCG